MNEIYTVQRPFALNSFLLGNKLYHPLKHIHRASGILYFFIFMCIFSWHSCLLHLTNSVIVSVIYLFNEERTAPRVWYTTRDKIITFAKWLGKTSLQLFFACAATQIGVLRKHIVVWRLIGHLSSLVSDRDKSRGSSNVTESWPWKCLIPDRSALSRSLASLPEENSVGGRWMYFFFRDPRHQSPRCRAAQCTLRLDWVRGHRRERAAVF